MSVMDGWDAAYATVRKMKRSDLEGMALALAILIATALPEHINAGGNVGEVIGKASGHSKVKR